MSFIVFCSVCGKRNRDNEYTFKNNEVICKDFWIVIYSKKNEIEK